MSQRVPIEKLENLEKKHNIEVNASAFLEYNDYSERDEVRIIGEVFGELHSDIKIILSIYNNQGEIIGTDYARIDADSFEGIEPFSETISAPKGENIAKARIYPQKY